MEPDPQSPSTSPEYTPRQLELLAALPKVGNRYPLARMMKGALITLRRDEQDDPELYVYAAHSLRELMDRFERMKVTAKLDQPTDDETGNTEPKRREYADKWTELKSRSTCFNQGAASWAGTIDLPLQEFLADTEAFIRRYQARDSFLKTKQAKVMITLDPMFENLSEDEQQRTALEWARLKEFFNGVAHHSQTTRPALESALERLEIFLHRHLSPVEVANKNAILAFIKGVEGS